MQQGAESQAMQAASRSWARQGKDPSPSIQKELDLLNVDSGP